MAKYNEVRIIYAAFHLASFDSVPYCVKGCLTVVLDASPTRYWWRYPCRCLPWMFPLWKPVIFRSKSYHSCFLWQVAYMHSKQIIHRDLKGANLLISNTG